MRRIHYQGKLDAVWLRRGKMDWLGMETMLADILTDPDLSAYDKVQLSKECVDAYTGRGHFPDLWDRETGARRY